MSGDERRGTDGGEHPLDVDARFADIVAHFHDGEPAPPHVVDDGAGREDPTQSTGRGATDSLFPPPVDERDQPPHGVAPGVKAPQDTSPQDRSPQDRAWSPDDVELAAQDELRARREREARIHAEVDRAVDRAVDQERFVPAEPPPIPRPEDLPGRLAWAAVLLGPIALVLFAVLWESAPSWLVGGVVLAIVVGFAFLVWRLPRTRDRDDGGDGAIV